MVDANGWLLSEVNVLNNGVVNVVALSHIVLEGNDVDVMVTFYVLLQVHKDCPCRDVVHVHVHWGPLTEGRHIRLRDYLGKVLCNVI